MHPQDFYSKWDSIIGSWFNNRNALDPLMDKNNTLSIDHLPEPYYGDMNCSVVIINLNPGIGLCEQSWLKQDQAGTFVNDVKNSNYSSYAKSFPLLPPDNKGPEPSVKWWKKRYDWVERILRLKKVTSNKKPFAIELVPLHSKAFNVANVSKYVNDIRNEIDIIGALEYAIDNSDAQMGLAIGRPIYDVLIKNGYQDVIEPRFRQPAEGIQRYYGVLVKGSRRILCTWSSGSNKAPAEVPFRELEEAIITKHFI